jgi:hypothetical protein
MLPITIVKTLNATKIILFGMKFKLSFLLSFKMQSIKTKVGAQQPTNPNKMILKYFAFTLYHNQNWHTL